MTLTLNFIATTLLKAFGVNYLNFKKEEVSEKEELRGAIDLHGEDSSKDEKNMLKSILDLDEITVDYNDSEKKFLAFHLILSMIN